VVGVVPSDVADLLRLVRLLWAGRNPLLGQEKGNGVPTTRAAPIDGDAASHDCAYGEASDNDAYGKACVDRADGHHNCTGGHHNCADDASSGGAHGHSSQDSADALHGGTRAPLLIGHLL